MRNFLAVIAKQRSGTNLLRRGLASDPNFIDLDEIFHVNGQGCFWDFCRKKTNTSGFTLPTVTEQKRLFKEFLESKDKNHIHIIDIKYDSLRTLDGTGIQLNAIPWVLSFLKEFNIPVIHLIRRNILKSLVSNMVAAKTKIWVIADKKHVKQTTLTLEKNKLIQELKKREAEIQTVQNWLYDNNIASKAIFYEHLLSVDGKKLRPRNIEKIKLLLSYTKDVSTQIKTAKTGRPLNNTLTNFDDIKFWLEETGHDWMCLV